LSTSSAAAQVAMALTDIVGVNEKARESEHLKGNAKAKLTTLVPDNAGDNISKAIVDEARIKKFKVPPRKVGETFAFLESIIESEVRSSSC
jgi:hypothetical protein